MPKRFLFLWILLAWGLVTGRMVERPFLPISGEPTLGPAGSPSHPLSVLRPQPRLLLHSTAERQSGLSWAIVPVQSNARIQGLGVTTAAMDARSAGTGGSARHFPLFPTGPPSDS